jgi:hypothetical protein
MARPDVRITWRQSPLMKLDQSSMLLETKTQPSKCSMRLLKSLCLRISRARCSLNVFTGDVNESTSLPKGLLDFNNIHLTRTLKVNATLDHDLYDSHFTWMQSRAL